MTGIFLNTASIHKILQWQIPHERRCCLNEWWSKWTNPSTKCPNTFSITRNSYDKPYINSSPYSKSSIFCLSLTHIHTHICICNLYQMNMLWHRTQKLNTPHAPPLFLFHHHSCYTVSLLLVRVLLTLPNSLYQQWCQIYKVEEAGFSIWYI